MAGTIALLDGLVQLGTRAYGSVLTSQAAKDTAVKNAERSIMELSYQQAREKRAEAIAAAETAKSMVSAKLVSGVALVTGLGIAGYVALNIFRRRR